MCKVGPFFKIGKFFLYNAINIENAEIRANKADNPYSHKELFEKYFPMQEYIIYPRGRVVYDLEKNISIIYVDRCINKIRIIKKIVEKFKIKNYRIAYDEHYCCKKCFNKKNLYSY